MLRRIAREAAAFAFYVALTMAMTWPLAIRLTTAVSDPGDPLTNTWILDWVCHSLLHAPLDLFQSPLYFPSRLSLAFSENLIGVALIVLPLHAAGVEPIAIYNIALILGFALSGYGAFVLARLLSGSTAGALIAGILFAFVGFKFDHLSHMQLQWSGWIPLLLAAIIAYWRTPSFRRALLIAAAFTMNGLTNVHYFLFGSLTAVLTVVLLAILERRRAVRFWLSLAGAFLIGGLVLLPALLPYRVVSREYAMKRDAWTARSGSGTPAAWFVAGPRSLVYGRMSKPELQRHEMQLFPGVMALALALFGLRRRPYPAVLWLAIGVFGSMGMHAFFHSNLYRHVPVFQAIRAPVRWAVIAYLGLAVLAAFGVPRRRGLAVLLIPLAALDVWPVIRWEHVVNTTPPVYRWLAKTRIAPLIELPGGGENEYRYLRGSMTHRLPQFNGPERAGHPVYRRIREKLDTMTYDGELLDLLERNGCRLVVAHVHAMNEQQRAWLKQNLGRLAFLRSFDHEIGGDFVFAITRNLPDWQRLREPDAPDPAGHLPAERLARMFAGQAIHSEAIVTVVESPQYGQQIRGRLHVHGWTLSPHTIKRVTVLLDAGRVRYDAAMLGRPEITQRYGWYYFVPKPGFDLIVPERPQGVPRRTELQVEVEDDGGRVMRSDDIVFEWDS